MTDAAAAARGDRDRRGRRPADGARLGRRPRARAPAERELNEALRRALLLLAAGGDPHRELGVDDRAVKALAVDLHTDERQQALVAGLDGLVLAARDLPGREQGRCSSSPADVDLAWRLFALGLLAEELAAGRVTSTEGFAST